MPYLNFKARKHFLHQAIARECSQCVYNTTRQNCLWLFALPGFVRWNENNYTKHNFSSRITKYRGYWSILCWNETHCINFLRKYTNSADLVTVFTITAHHTGISVDYIAQNLFPPGKYSKSISIICHVSIVFRNARDERQLIILGSQIFPGKIQFLLLSNHMINSVINTRPYEYLLTYILPHQNCLYQLRPNIFPGE